MIKTFNHKGLEAFFLTGSKAGIRPDHASKLRLLLARLDDTLGRHGKWQLALNLPLPTGWQRGISQLSRLSLGVPNNAYA
jgi:hypothetical protein